MAYLKLVNEVTELWTWSLKFESGILREKQKCIDLYLQDSPRRSVGLRPASHQLLLRFCSVFVMAVSQEWVQ